MDASLAISGGRPPFALRPMPASKYGADRQTHLVRTEQAAFASILKAYARLADTPLDSHRLKAARRAVHDSKEWWIRALGELDQPQDREWAHERT